MRNFSEAETNILPDLLAGTEWTSYFRADNREGSQLPYSSIPWTDIPEKYLIIKDGILYLYEVKTWNVYIGPSSVEYCETQFPYVVSYESEVDDSGTVIKKPTYCYKNSYGGYTEFKVEQDGNSIVVCCNYYYYWLTSPENINPTNGNSSALSVQVLIDDNELGEACVLSDDAIKTLSFTLLDGENDDTGSLASVTAKWQILSGESYVSLSSTEGNRIQITNENYSGSSQTVSLRLSVTAKDGTNRSASSIVTLTAAALPKKKVFAKILSNGRSVSTAETLGSTAVP